MTYTFLADTDHLLEAMRAIADDRITNDIIEEAT